MNADVKESAYWIRKAGELESAHGARNDKINEREQIYHKDWKGGPDENDENVERVVDIMPAVVCDRAVDKITSMPAVLRCRSELNDLESLPPEVLQMVMNSPEAMEDAIQKLEKRSRDLADLKESTVLGLIQRLERQQRQRLVRPIARNAVVDGFAGPVRWGYDENCSEELGSLPFYFQVLDPRCYYELQSVGSGFGPRFSVYKREASRLALDAEGWDVFGSGVLDELAPDAIATVYDCWQRVRKPGKGKPTFELWHCIILHGGAGEQLTEFLKKPTNMAKLGMNAIPYVCVPVREDPYANANYPGEREHAFIDPYLQNWPARCRLLSRQAELVAMAVEPTTVTRSKGPVDVEVGRGANIQVDTDESVEVLRLNADPTIAQAWNMVESQTQRGTFAAASYGEGTNINSALQAGRLQEASEGSLAAPRDAVQLALECSVTILTDLMRAFGKRRQFKVPGRGFSTALLDPKGLSGEEIWEVQLPSMSRVEANQQAAAAKALSEPRQDGTKWIADETSREMSGVLQNEHQESSRLEGEMRRKIEMVDVPASQLQNQAAIENKMNEARAQMAFQQEAQQQAGAPQAPEAPSGPGVAMSPQQEGPPPVGMVQHDPRQPVAGAT